MPQIPGAWQEAAMTGIDGLVGGIGQAAIDPDGVNAFGRPLRVAARRPGAAALGTGRHQAGLGARLDQAAAPEAEAGGGQAGHLVHGGVQRKEAEVAAEMTQHPWKSAPEPRMGEGILGQAVGTDHAQRMSEDQPHIGLAHAVVDGARRLQATGGFLQIQTPVGGDGRSRDAGWTR